MDRESRGVLKGHGLMLKQRGWWEEAWVGRGVEGGMRREGGSEGVVSVSGSEEMGNGEGDNSHTAWVLRGGGGVG